MPWLAFFMVFFSSISVPANGFAGELLILLGMFQRAGTTTAAMRPITAPPGSGVALVHAWLCNAFLRPAQERTPSSKTSVAKSSPSPPACSDGLRPGDF